jgi:branched-subunit amino acid transport protein AzlD
VGLHLWRRKAMVTILGGTSINAALTTAFPAH